MSNEAIKKIKMMSSKLQKLVEEESQKKLTAIHEQMQESLQAINSGLVKVQDDEEELQNFVCTVYLSASVVIVFPFLDPMPPSIQQRPRPDLPEGGRQGHRRQY